jgi:hypothetical protein
MGDISTDPKPQTNQKKSKAKRWIAIGIGVFLFLCFVGAASDDSTQRNTKTTKQPVATANPKTSVPKQAQPAPAQATAPALSSDPITRIQQIPAKYYDKFDITMFDQNGNLANASNGPWEVVINSPLYAFSICSGAENTIYNVMKDLYTDSVTRPNIYMVKMSLSNQAQASLHRNDGYTLSADTWDNLSGPGLAKALYGTNSQQTYWKPINGNCVP